jgi:hypothetical protein
MTLKGKSLIPLHNSKIVNSRHSVTAGLSVNEEIKFRKISFVLSHQRISDSPKLMDDN